jgi:dihydrofolate synthase/folylpolyglutamate synthase
VSLSYDEALDYLYSLINYELNRPVRYTPDVVSLERPRQLMAALGDPHERYPVIHVTGTKGKGSVSAMCAGVLAASGLRVGLYSSPHLQDFRERFRINDELMPQDRLPGLVARIRHLVDQIPGLTWFEVITAIAFLYFADEQVDVAVIEVGLGGRLDATNIIKHPVVSVITSLSFDHTHLLGNTLGEIAYEKGGIIKPGVPIVSAPQPPEARLKLESIAAERNAPLTLIGRDWITEALGSDAQGQTFQAGKVGQPPTRYWTPLIGPHQSVNGAVALAALDHARAVGLPITDEALLEGLRTVNWPGRFEIVAHDPVVILDAAHNADSAKRLAETLEAVYPGVHPLYIFGAFTDKDVDGMFKVLLPTASTLILMKALNPRAFDTDTLREKAVVAGFKGEMETIPVAVDALARARELATPHSVIVVTGSVSLVGEMRGVLGLPLMRAAYLKSLASGKGER